jgi:hypothetical protein
MREKSFTFCFLLLFATAALAAPASFLTKECEFRLGETAMIPLKLDAPAEEPTTSTLAISRPGFIEVLRQPEFLAGHSTGFARIRTLKPGSVEVTSGNSRMTIQVSPERPLSMVRQMRPRFTSPSEGSHVWGAIAIGAEMWVGAPGVDREITPKTTLHLPDGRTLKPVEAFPPVDGPFWRLVFHLDTTSLPPGECAITISATPPIEGASKTDLLTSEPHTLHILPPPTNGDIVASGECENTLDTPRAERMGLEPPGITMDPHASGHRAVALRRNRPAWVIQPDIKSPGRYQLMVRARGTIAGSAYPSLGLVLGEQATDSGSVRLSSAAWHDVPVGRPVKLEAGPQWIGVTLANEFNYRNQLQRTAEIDSFTLRRVPDATTSAGAGMMMTGDMMMGSNKKTETGNKPASPTSAPPSPPSPMAMRSADARPSMPPSPARPSATSATTPASAPTSGSTDKWPPPPAARTHPSRSTPTTSKKAKTPSKSTRSPPAETRHSPSPRPSSPTPPTTRQKNWKPPTKPTATTSSAGHGNKSFALPSKKITHSPEKMPLPTPTSSNRKNRSVSKSHTRSRENAASPSSPAPCPVPLQASSRPNSTSPTPLTNHSAKSNSRI